MDLFYKCDYYGIPYRDFMKELNQIKSVSPKKYGELLQKKKAKKACYKAMNKK